LGALPVKIQLVWRIAGVVCLVGCLLMVFMSGTILHPGMSRIMVAGYWFVFVLLMMAALYSALLDLRFTRMEFKMRERALFQETFMTDEFRKVVEDAKKKSAEEEHPDAP